MRILVAAALALLVAGCGRETAPPASQSKLTIDRIFASPSLSGPTPRSLKLSPDGRYATLLQARADDRQTPADHLRLVGVRRAP